MKSCKYCNKTSKETNQRKYSEAATESYIDVLSVLSKCLKYT